MKPSGRLGEVGVTAVIVGLCGFAAATIQFAFLVQGQPSLPGGWLVVLVGMAVFVIAVLAIILIAKRLGRL